MIRALGLTQPCLILTMVEPWVIAYTCLNFLVLSRGIEMVPAA